MDRLRQDRSPWPPPTLRRPCRLRCQLPPDRIHAFPPAYHLEAALRRVQPSWSQSRGARRGCRSATCNVSSILRAALYAWHAGCRAQLTVFIG